MHLTDNRQLSFGFGGILDDRLICRATQMHSTYLAALRRYIRPVCTGYADAFVLFAPLCRCVGFVAATTQMLDLFAVTTCIGLDFVSGYSDA